MENSYRSSQHLLEQIEMSFRPQMEARSQEFRIEKCRISHEWLIGDSVRVLQILNNLLSNAMKYTQTGGKITLHVEELEQTSDHYAQMCLRVADNGIGMSKEFLGRIYESFSREERTTINTVQGTGLGMSIVKTDKVVQKVSKDVQNAFNAGMNAHIAKPVDMKVLIKTVRNLQTGAGAAETLN